MARYLILWQQNPVAPSPADLSEALKLNEKIFAGVDDLLKKGEIEEIGFFQDATSGYAILKGEATDVFRNVNMFLPYFLCEVNEIIPYKTGKEITMAQLKAQIAAK